MSFFPEKVLAQYIQVDDSYTAQNLVQNVLINSPCAGVSNFSVSGGNFGTGENSYGYFSAGSSSFPFANGIVLSTGKATSAMGPNASILSEDAPGWTGDSDLENALSISSTSDATVLEFDFTPLTSQVSFDYIFASEEYHGTAPCTYSDGFAFLLKVAGSTSPYQNLALVPNTNTPVKVTTVHPNISGGCPAINDTYFGSYNGPNAPINFNGQTVIMTAKSGVTPGTTYHIKLVIADETNPQYDSAIFLGGGSFKVGVDLGVNHLVATNNPICVGETYQLNATQAGTNTYKWYKNGLLIPGEINPTYTVTSSGTYGVKVTLGSTSCDADGEVTIEYSPLPTLNNEVLVQCDDNNDGVTLFNLTKLDSLIKNGDTTLGSVTYYENLANAQTQTSPILNPASYQNTTTNNLIARVANTFGCVNFATVTLIISNNTIANPNYATCDLDTVQDGLITFDLNTMLTPQLLTGLPTGLVVSYYNSLTDALLEQNVLANNFTNTSNPQTIYARIINGSDCYALTPVVLTVNAFNPPNFQDENSYICDGNPITLEVANTFNSYLWSNGATTNQITVSTGGNYFVTVTNANNCATKKNFNVLPSGAAIITGVEVNDFEGNENSILVHYTGIGNYVFSIDGINFQESPLFTNVPIGSYTITVRDKNGCGDTFSQLIYVLDYPRFFTPNGDGINDYWRISNLENQPNVKINIYDRFGKLLKQFSSTGTGWDGTYNGTMLPADDYWFYFVLENNRTIKGHFCLKR